MLVTTRTFRKHVTPKRIILVFAIFLTIDLVASSLTVSADGYLVSSNTNLACSNGTKSPASANSNQYPDLRNQFMVLLAQQLTSHSVALLALVTALFTFLQFASSKQDGKRRIPLPYLVLWSIATALFAGAFYMAGRLIDYGESMAVAVNMPYLPVCYAFNMSTYSATLTEFAVSRTSLGFLVTDFGGIFTLGFVIAVLSGGLIASLITQKLDLSRTWVSKSDRILYRNSYIVIMGLSIVGSVSIPHLVLGRTALTWFNAIPLWFHWLDWLVLVSSALLLPWLPDTREDQERLVANDPDEPTATTS
jgi:hypothetical protein